jgi:hypothetical protein
LRKYLIAGLAALIAVGCADIARAQNPAPAPTMTVNLTPSKAGTKKKPKSAKVRLKIENNVESKTTMSTLQLDFDKTVKLSGRGLTKCSRSVLEQPNGVSACPRASRAGSGVAHALVGPHLPTPSSLTLDVDAFVGGNNLIYFRVQGRELPNVIGLLEGRITKSGHRLTLSIPDELKQPAPGTFSALVDLEATLSLKKGKNALLSTNGCKSRKHTTKATLTYSPNPVPPASTTATTNASSRCSK